ncbi:MAG: hypothetical protein KGI27_06535 [Thaumarchaeota archaeon]|nr:hypothetical protein [Nitrososphaerota archaeon]
MAMSHKDNDHIPGVHELEYLNKIGWLWDRLSSQQRSKIESSVFNNTLRQENSRHCLIGEAVGVSRTGTIQHDSLILDAVFGLVRTIFYDGPNYNHLFDRKITKKEKEVLNDIYYAKIGNREHQYRRANELIRFYIANHVSIF